MKLSTCCQSHASAASDDICSRCGMHAEFTEGGEFKTPRNELAFDAWYAANELETELTEDDDPDTAPPFGPDHHYRVSEDQAGL